jgi:Tfp pilus assembly protein PilX
MEIFLLVVALIVLASLQYQVDQRRIHDDYEDWKNNRR